MFSFAVFTFLCMSFVCNFQEDIAKLLRFESSLLAPGEKTTLEDYCSRMKAGARNIYYLSSPRYD